VAVLEADPERRLAVVAHDFDDFRDPVVLAHGPAVHSQMVARGGTHRE
jgi:hypothetical protein